MSNADECKALGNTAVKEQRFDDAIGHYTEGIEFDSANHVLFSNRSAAFASKKDYGAALLDAEKAISIKPDWAKGYGRKGAALFGSGDYVAAKLAYEEGLKVDPSTKMNIDGAAAADEQIKKQMDRQRSGQDNQMNQLMQVFSAPDALARLAANPKTAPYLADPAFMTKFQAIQQNPDALQTNMDEKIITCMMVLMGQGDAMAEPDASASQPAPAAAPKEAPAAPKEEPAEMTEEDKAQEAAAAEKALGTASYKNKDFDTALAHYRKASELDSTNMVYLLNTSAVFMEKKEFEAAIAEATKAVEVGQDNRGDFKMMGKAYARIAKAHFLMGDLEEASRFYDRSLSNARTAVVLEEKKKVDKAIKEKARLAYIDPEKAKEAKGRGNALFKGGDFPGAIKEYSEAIKRNPDEAAFYSNRAACYTKLAEPGLALADADTCISLDPKFIKGYVRRGNSLLASRKKKEAEEAFVKAAEIDPNHPEVVQGLQRCRAYYSAKPGQTREERAADAMKDPEIQEIMNDPIMRTILGQMSSDPGAAQEHMKNPAIAAKIHKLLEAGVIGQA